MTGPVVALGVFDGVHKGHQAVLRQAKARAINTGASLLAASFHPHPAAVIAPGSEPPLLTTPIEREELLRAAGADEVYFIDFTPSTCDQTPEEFVDTFIVRTWGASAVIIGENYRFGRGASGDFQRMQELGAERGFAVEAVELAADTQPWSSTRARRLIAGGDVRGAIEILGHLYSLRGTVVHGDHRGRELGIPTANLEVPTGRLIPGEGVYAGYAHWTDSAGNQERFPAAISVGTNPQFQGAQMRVEAHLLDLPSHHSDLYGVSLTTEFLDKVRDQVIFESLEEYLAQMPRDLEAVRRLC